MEEKNIQMAESFLKRAWNKFNEAKSYLENYHHPESISASQECIELSIKAIFLLLQKEYPRKHEFEEGEFKPLHVFDFFVPFSFTHLVGILLGLIVILVRKWKFVLTILAGILMILGVLGAVLNCLFFLKISTELLWLPLLLSIVYLVFGSVLARKFKK
jgi:hypothetical protein